MKYDTKIAISIYRIMYQTISASKRKNNTYDIKHYFKYFLSDLQVTHNIAVPNLELFYTQNLLDEKYLQYTIFRQLIISMIFGIRKCDRYNLRALNKEGNNTCSVPNLIYSNVQLQVLPFPTCIQFLVFISYVLTLT